MVIVKIVEDLGSANTIGSGSCDMRTLDVSKNVLGMSPFQATVGGGQGEEPCGYSYEDKGMRHGQGELRHPAIVTILRAGVTKLPLVVR